MAKRKSIDRRMRHVAGCIFCGCKDLSRTHIWPNWLNTLLSPPAFRLLEFEAPTRLTDNTKNNRKKAEVWPGSIFTQKPYLCCIPCNTGWMQRFEDEMLKFSTPIFQSSKPVTLDRRQLRVFVVWLSIIIILAEYIDTSKGSISISLEDRKYLSRASLFAVLSSH